MKLRRMLLLIPVLFANASAQETAIPPDDLVYCTVCHGVQLMGNEVLRAPRISGMEPWYVKRQLLAFRDGWRGLHDDDEAGREMQPMAAALDTEQLIAATEFVAAASSPPPGNATAGDPGAGADYFVTCAACHGERGEGNRELGGPSLTELNDWYMIAQLQNYRAGVRGSHPEDTLGQQMQAAVVVLPDDQAILDVIAYIESL